MSEREIGNECLNEAKQILGLETDKEVQVAFGSWMKENFPEMWADAESNVDNLDDEDYGHFADLYVCAIGRSGGAHLVAVVEQNGLVWSLALSADSI